MLWVSGSGVGVGVCARAGQAPASAIAPTARQAPVSVLTRRVVRFRPYNRSPSSSHPSVRPLAARPGPSRARSYAVGGPERLVICRKVGAPEATCVGRASPAHPRILRRVGINGRTASIDRLRAQLVVPRLVGVDAAQPVLGAVLGQPRR